MNKIKILLITLVIIIIGAFILYGVKADVKKEIIEQQIQQVTSTSTTYFSIDGKTADVTYYSDDTAMLTLLNSEYQNIRFTIAVSASGARYENTEKGLVLWEKSPELTIYKDDKNIFQGSFKDNLKQSVSPDLTSFVWKWKETTQGVKTITPKNPSNFTLTFTDDGNVNGTTDCNNFSGTYFVDTNNLKFGSFMSTLMFCEGSQEQDFITSIKDGEFFIQDDILSLKYGDVIVLFDKVNSTRQ